MTAMDMLLGDVLASAMLADLEIAGAPPATPETVGVPFRDTTAEERTLLDDRCEDEYLHYNFLEGTTTRLPPTGRGAGLSAFKRTDTTQACRPRPGRAARRGAYDLLKRGRDERTGHGFWPQNEQRFEMASGTAVLTAADARRLRLAASVVAAADNAQLSRDGDIRRGNAGSPVPRT